MKNTVLITGASGGIGSAIAGLFAENGYAVAMQYHKHADRLLEATATFPDDAVYLCAACDVTDSNSVNALKDQIHERLGEISVLINCAGVAIEQKLLKDTTDAEYDRIFETNVHGMIRVTRTFYEDLRRNQGAIVNLSSVWGVAGGSCEVLYSASKAAVIGFTKSLSKELAPSGVTVNCIAPGWIPTNMNAHLSEHDMLAFTKDTPLGRLGSASEIADAAFYLANARFITGQILRCDGGYSI